MARGPARGARKKSTVRVNFSGVETQSVIPEGEYITEVVSCKVEESQSGNDYLAWELKIVGGKHAGKKLYNNTSLAEQSLWATKRFLECLGVEVPDGELDLDMDEMLEMQVGVVVEHEVYKGRARSKVVDVFPAEDDGDEKGDKDDKEEKASFTAEDINGMGKKELKELVEEHELDVDTDGSTSTVRRAVLKALEKEGLIGNGKKAKVEDEEDDEKPPARRGRKAKDEDEEEEKPARRGRRAAKEEDEDEEEEKPARRGRRAAKDEDDEEEAKPARRGRRASKDEDDEDEKPKGKKGKAKKYSADAINGMSEDELTEVIETHELDVDLDEHSTMRRKRSAVIDALEGAELLDD